MATPCIISASQLYYDGQPRLTIMFERKTEHDLCLMLLVNRCVVGSK